MASLGARNCHYTDILLYSCNYFFFPWKEPSYFRAVYNTFIYLTYQISFIHFRSNGWSLDLKVETLKCPSNIMFFDTGLYNDWHLLLLSRRCNIVGIQYYIQYTITQKY